MFSPLRWTLHEPSPNTPSQTKRARYGLAIFSVVLIAGSAYFEHRILVLGGSIYAHLGWIYALVWWVTASSIIARLILRESPHDVSFRWGGSAGTFAMAVATALPLAVGFVAYGIGWSSGLAHFSGPEFSHGIFGVHLVGGPTKRFVKLLFVNLTIGGLWTCRAAAGEEIGWRGYMLTRLIDSGLPVPILISGLIWGLWHIPLILSGQYASGPYPLLSAFLFLCGIMAAGFVFAWLRLSSGSIWPCIWAHSVWNSVIQGSFDRSTKGYSVWVGESGVLTVAVLILFAFALYRFLPLAQRVTPSKKKQAHPS